MGATIQMIYQGQYQTLIQMREDHVRDLESINNQIADLRRRARREGIDLDNDIWWCDLRLSLDL